MKTRGIYLILLLLVSIFLRAQTKGYVDQVVDSVDTKHLTDPNEITSVIEGEFKTDSEKVRAIYYWITQNIDYDCHEFHCGVGIALSDDDFEDKLLTKTTDTRRGICYQYALLFKYMCNYCHIPAEIITGYAATEKLIFLHKLMGNGAENHAWNAVYINRHWYLLDVTWASGYCNASVTHYTRQLNDAYYLTRPKDFLLDHHPVNIEWELVKRPLRFSPWVSYVIKGGTDNNEATSDNGALYTSNIKK